MDFRNRNYYMVEFSSKCMDYRISQLKLIPTLKFIKFYECCVCKISVNKQYSNLIEYELSKAKNRDGFCLWYRV